MDPRIDGIVEQVVQLVEPLEVFLFGSAARGEPARDVDLMVVMPDGTHRSRTAERLYLGLRGLGLPVDFIVATPSDLARHRDNVGLIYRAVLREGQRVYAAHSSAAR